MNAGEVIEYIWNKFGLLFYDEKNNGVLVRVDGKYPGSNNQLLLVRNLGRIIGVHNLLTTIRYQDISRMYYQNRKLLDSLLKYYKSIISY